jgi:hypothetical protein
VNATFLGIATSHQALELFLVPELFRHIHLFVYLLIYYLLTRDLKNEDGERCLVFALLTITSILFVSTLQYYSNITVFEIPVEHVMKVTCDEVSLPYRVHTQA